MRPLLALLVLAWASCASAQVPMTGAGLGAPGGSGPPPSCTPGTHASTLLARTSGLSGTETAAYCNLINGLDTDGTFGLFDALWILSTKNAATAELNLVSSNFSSFTVVGSCTFTADQGYTGDGSTCYISTGYNPTAATTPNMTISSAMLGVYVLTNNTVAPGSVYTDIGADFGNGSSTTSFNYIIPMLTDGGSYASLLASVNNGPQAVGNTDGLWMVTSSGSTTAFYRNGSSLVSNAITPSNIANQPFVVLAHNEAAASGGINITQFSPHQVSAAWVGGLPNSTQAGQISSRINAFMTALGINVY